MLSGQGFHAVVVDFLFSIEAVGHNMKPLAREVQRHAMGKVTTFGKRQAHDGVARL